MVLIRFDQFALVKDDIDWTDYLEEDKEFQTMLEQYENLREKLLKEITGIQTFRKSFLPSLLYAS